MCIRDRLDGLLKAVHGSFQVRLDDGRVVHPGASELLVVGIEYLGVFPVVRSADAIIVVRDVKEVTHHDQLAAVLVHPAKADDGIAAVVVGNPGEPFPCLLYTSVRA